MSIDLTNLSVNVEGPPDFATQIISVFLEAAKSKSIPSSSGKSESKPNDSTVEVSPVDRSKAETQEKDSRQKGGKRSSKASSVPNIDANLNLEPADKMHFGDFVGKRDLSSAIDKICGSIYYLRNILELDPVGPDQIATCFIQVSWDWPANFKNTISKGKSARRLVYDSMDDIKLTTTETNAMRKEGKID